MTQLLITLELWTEILDSRVSFDCIYLDFKQDFDQRPLSKLDGYCSPSSHIHDLMKYHYGIRNVKGKEECLNLLQFGYKRC